MSKEMIKQKSYPYKETIKSLPLFSELNVEDLRKLTSISKTIQVKKNEFLFQEKDIYKGFYILLKGAVKAYKIANDGRETVVHIIKPINIFADIPLFEGKDYPVNAQCLEESVLLFVPKAGFLDLMNQNTNIALKMLGGFAKRLKELVEQIEIISSKEVTGRFAKYLLNEIKNAGTERLPEPFVKLKIPKSAIAGYLGTITETLSRTLKKLQNDGIIKVNSKVIIVTDYKKLIELAK